MQVGNTFNRKGLLLWFCANVEVVDNKTSILTVHDDKKSLYSTTPIRPTKHLLFSLNNLNISFFKKIGFGK